MLQLSAPQRAKLAASPNALPLVSWGLAHMADIQPLIADVGLIGSAVGLSAKWSGCKLAGDVVVRVAQDCPLLPASLKDPSNTVGAAAHQYADVDQFLALPHIIGNGQVVQWAVDHLGEIEKVAGAIFAMVMAFA